MDFLQLFELGDLDAGLFSFFSNFQVTGGLILAGELGRVVFPGKLRTFWTRTGSANHVLIETFVSSEEQLNLFGGINNS